MSLASRATLKKIIIINLGNFTTLRELLLELYKTKYNIHISL